MLLFSFFFFQAEDGIRDHCVTGVQTCALPISTKAGTEKCHGSALGADEIKGARDMLGWTHGAFEIQSEVREAWRAAAERSKRSEERRVGKECRCRGWR